MVSMQYSNTVQHATDNSFQYPEAIMTSQPQVIPVQPQSQPRIQFFISRTNGTLTPLIPADELPFNVRLQGIRRVLALEQTHGMQHVGSAPYTGLTFRLEQEIHMQRSSSQPQKPVHARSQSNDSPEQFLPPDALARQAIANSSTNFNGINGSQQAPPKRPLSAHEMATSWRKAPTSEPQDKAQAIIDAIVSSGAGAETAARIGYGGRSPAATAPSGNVPDQEKKEYCTYWIRTGECDYTQQGCLFKHEMPDIETLRKIGFRRYPEWWTEKNQKIKLGGERAMVGPVVKPSVWLNRRSASGSGSDEEGNDGSTSKKSSVSDGEVAAAATSKLSTKAGGQQPAPQSAHSTATSTGQYRKLSNAGDLIDFAPLLPTPSTTPPATAPNSGSPRSGTSEEAVPSDKQSKQRPSAKGNTPQKVFVPAGESPEVHRAKAKKFVARHSPTSARSRDTTTAPPIAKQIQKLQHQSVSKGMMASQHAPPTVQYSTTNEQTATTQKPITKAPCRVRRPASAPVATALTPKHDTK